MNDGFRFILDDIPIRIVESIEVPQNASAIDYFTQLNDNEFYLQVPNVADFRAVNGAYIEVSPKENATKKDIELYLNGSVYGALLYQRKVLILHASSVSINDSGIIIAGESGAGKSTLTFGLHKVLDAKILNDDITPINCKDLSITSSSDRIKLWDNTLAHFEIKTDKLEQVRSDTRKFFYEINQSHEVQSPIRAILFLETTNEAINGIKIASIHGVEKFKTLHNNLYRADFLEGMKDTKVLFFKDLARIAESIPFFRITRPEKFNISDLVGETANFLKKEL